MSQFIIKICYTNGAKDYSKGLNNCKFLKYMATRLGVESEVDNELFKFEKEEEAEIFNDSFDDIEDDIHDFELPEHGLFGKIKNIIPDLEELEGELESREDTVWRMIISLKEDDAQKLGFTDVDKWQNTLRNCMSDVLAKGMFEPTNTSWYAAIHMEKGHPHAHVMFWENEPRKIDGYIPNSNIQEMRKILIREVYREENQLLYMQKNAARDIILEGSNQSINDLVNRMKNEIKPIEKEFSLNEISPMAPKLYPDKENELFEKIKELSNIMPEGGKAFFKFMPEDVKTEVLKISQYILSQDGFNEQLFKYIENTSKIAEHYTGDKDKIKESINNAKDDLEKRISQYILKAARVIQKNEKSNEDNDYKSSRNQNSRIVTKVWSSAFKSIVKDNQNESSKLLRRTKSIVKSDELQNKKIHKIDLGEELELRMKGDN